MVRPITFALVLFMAACGGSGGQSTGIQDVSCPPDSTLTYANFGQDVISTNCLECHDGKERPNLATQAAVQSHVDDILSVAVYSDSMPQRSTMPLPQRQALGEWLSCGAP